MTNEGSADSRSWSLSSILSLLKARYGRTLGGNGSPFGTHSQRGDLRTFLPRSLGNCFSAGVVAVVIFPAGPVELGTKQRM